MKVYGAQLRAKRGPFTATYTVTAYSLVFAGEGGDRLGDVESARKLRSQYYKMRQAHTSLRFFYGFMTFSAFLVHPLGKISG